MALFDVIRLEKWQKYQPISILSLDIPDRTVLRVAGMFVIFSIPNHCKMLSFLSIKLFGLNSNFIEILDGILRDVRDKHQGFD